MTNNDASVFELVCFDQDPLPNLTRAPLLWDGFFWQEIDPATGHVVSEGEEQRSHVSN